MAWCTPFSYGIQAIPGVKDEALWKWSSSATYSFASAFLPDAQRGSIEFACAKAIWNCKFFSGSLSSLDL